MPNYRDFKSAIEFDLKRAEEIKRLPLEQRRQHPDDPEGWSYRLIPGGILRGAIQAADNAQGDDQSKILMICARVVLLLVCRYIYSFRPALKDRLLHLYEKMDLTGATRAAMEAFERGEFGSKQVEGQDWVMEQLMYLRGRGWYVDLLQACRSMFLACAGMRDQATGMSRIPWTLVIENNAKDPFHALTAWLSKLWATGALEDETLMRRLDLWVRRLPFVWAWAVCLVGGKALTTLSSLGVALMVLNLKGGVQGGGVLWAVGAGVVSYVVQNAYRDLVLVGTVTSLRWLYIAATAFLTLGGFFSLSALGQKGVTGNPKPVVVLTLVFLAVWLVFTFVSKKIRVRAEQSLLEVEQAEALAAESVKDLMSEMESQLDEQLVPVAAPSGDREAELRAMPWEDLKALARERGVEINSRDNIVRGILEKEGQHV